MKTSVEKLPAARLIMKEEFRVIYASLGAESVGETVEVVSRKARIAAEKVNDILKAMEDVGFVKFDKSTQKYLPLSSGIDVVLLRSSEIFETEYFQALARAKSRFSSQASSADALFMIQTFSVSKERLSALSKELAVTIERFASEAEVPSGETIAEICISLTDNSNVIS